jgi:hypothetical protein
MRTKPQLSTSGSLEPAEAPSCPGPSFPNMDFSAISPAQLAANRANAQLSTGPRTAAGLAKSSQNAVKSALTGRTVLLPTDDVQEYSTFLAGFQSDLQPLGQLETELVQIIVDCFWRLRRIQALEFALYAHGHSQFEHAFDDQPEENRSGMILLQTHMTYEKQFRNWQIQEARLDRKKMKAMSELNRLQAERTSAEATESAEATAIPDHRSMSDDEFFRALDAGYVPPYIAAVLAEKKALQPNGFDFSNPSAKPNSEAA